MHRTQRKLSPQQVIAIRSTTESAGVIADRLGMARSTICKVRKGTVTYKEVRCLDKDGFSPQTVLAP
jgi:hypothetical protein